MTSRTPSLAKWLHPWQMTATLWWKTLTDTAVYRLAVHLSPRFLAFYSVVTYAVLAILATAVFTWQNVPLLEARSQEAWTELKNTWPENLVFTYENGQLSNTLDEPLNVGYPSVWTRPEGLPEHFAVVYPTEAESPNPETKALFSLTSKDLTLQTSTGETQSLPWTNVLSADSLKLSRNSLPEWDGFIQELTSTLKAQAIIAFFFWSWWGVLLSRILLLLLYAFVAQTIFYFAQNRVKYWHAFKIGLFLLPISELLLIIWKAMRPELSPALPFWWLWLLLVIVVAITNRGGKLS